jgi:glycosyltransferase involved in cell wall biosynthesis
MIHPRISIVLATHNRSHLLPRAVASVAGGTYSNFELIIVDDGSTDDTREVAARFTDPRIRYVQLPENGGVLRARNRGFDLATGQYITLLDDDDELVPDALETVATWFARVGGEVDILWFDCIDVELGHRSGSMPDGVRDISFESYLCGRISGDFWMAFAARAIAPYRFDERLRAHESLLWLRIHRTHRARYIPLVLCRKYREHGSPRLCEQETRARHVAQTALAMSAFADEFGGDLERLAPDRYGKLLAYVGLYRMAVDDFPAGRALILRSFKYRLSLKYLALLAASPLLKPRHVAALIARADAASS